MKRIAFYGGSFDPVHRGHMAVAFALLEQFRLDEFVFMPAFQAPHKKRKTPTSAYDRYAMLSLVTNDEPCMSVSRLEIETPDRPYSVQTMTKLSSAHPKDKLFFVMGADSWMAITTWLDWESLLSLTNHIVVTRPGTSIGTSHVSEATRSRIVDLRGAAGPVEIGSNNGERKIFFTNVVEVDVSALGIREKIREQNTMWRSDVPKPVAKYIEKYQIYN